MTLIYTNQEQCIVWRRFYLYPTHLKGEKHANRQTSRKADY